MQILLVEDSVKSQRAISFALRKSGYAVKVVSDGREALDQLKTERYAAAILDLMLPGLDGLTCLGRAREAGVRTPVLVVTAKTTLGDRVSGLQTGADDYLTKPFALEELLARLKVLLRCYPAAERAVLRVGDLEVDSGSCQVRWGGASLELTPREFKVLRFLAENAGRAVSRLDIEREVYGEERGAFSNVVESTISTLRRKLVRPGMPALIRTERGAGYTLGRE